jgi:hypothetical protein
MVAFAPARTFTLLACALAFTAAGLWPTSARSQAVGTPSANPIPPPPVATGDGLGSETPSSPAAGPVYVSDPTQVIPADVGPGPLEVIRESIFGPAPPEQWHPLSLSTFFSEGWDEAFVRSPEGTNGAPKQNWTGSADGIFVRLNSLSLFFMDNMTSNSGLLLTPLPWSPTKPKTTGNDYFATYELFLPMNQRLELLIVAPYIASNTTGPTGHYVGNFGDLTFEAKFRFIEQRNFSVMGFVAERTPTGKTVNGNDINLVVPSLEFWWNFAPKWVVRGGTGINIDTGRTSATDSYYTKLAMGRYITTKDARFFKQLVAYLAVATQSDVLGRAGHITDVYVTPGCRFGLDDDEKWFVIGAIQVPVAGPHPYDFGTICTLVRQY